MNSVNSKIVKNFIRGFLFSFFFFIQVTVHAWEIDLSRRQTQPVNIDNQRLPASFVRAASKRVDKSTDAEILEALKNVVSTVEISRDIVIVNTDTGFVPELVQVKKGESYRIHIVNLNMILK